MRTISRRLLFSGFVWAVIAGYGLMVGVTAQVMQPPPPSHITILCDGHNTVEGC